MYVIGGQMILYAPASTYHGWIAFGKLALWMFANENLQVGGLHEDFRDKDGFGAACRSIAAKTS